MLAVKFLNSLMLAIGDTGQDFTHTRIDLLAV